MEKMSSVAVIEEEHRYYRDVTDLLSKNGFNVLPLGLSGNYDETSFDEQKNSILTRLDKLVTGNRVDLVISDLFLQETPQTDNFVSVAVVNELSSRYSVGGVIFNLWNRRVGFKTYKAEDFYKIEGVKPDWVFMNKPKLIRPIPRWVACPAPQRCNLEDGFDECKHDVCFLQRVKYVVAENVQEK